MSKRTMSIILIIGGVVLLALSLAADQLGIGSQPGMHWKQWGGTVAGAAAVIAGAWLVRGKPAEKK